MDQVNFLSCSDRACALFSGNKLFQCISFLSVWEQKLSRSDGALARIYILKFTPINNGWSTRQDTALVSTHEHDNQLHTPEKENIQMSEEFPSKIMFDKFSEIVANIPKMNFYSSYFLQYYLQNDGVEAICMEGSQSRFRIKRGSWCCHWMQYAHMQPVI